MTDTTENLSKQEENWMMMTILQIPWHHANQITDEDDRKFLLLKAEEALRHMQLQQQAQQEQARQNFEGGIEKKESEEAQCCGAKDK